MLRIRRDPIWLVLPAVCLLIWGLLFDPSNRKFYLFWLAMLAVFLISRLVFWLIKRVVRAPVPDSAIQEMLYLCRKDNEEGEWSLVEFRPKVSLEEARDRVGMETYSKEDRLNAFMKKFSMIVPYRPDVAIFYSPEKGFLLVRTAMIQALEAKYGKWTLDTWYTFNGAMKRMGIGECNLDGGQNFMYDGQWMAHDPFLSMDEWLRVLSDHALLLNWAGARGLGKGPHNITVRFWQAALFDRAVAGSVKLGRFADAMVYTEQGKRLSFNDLLNSREVKPGHIIEAEWSDYQERLNEARNLERHLASSRSHNPGGAEEYRHIRDNLAQVLEQIEGLERRFRAADPDYLPTSSPLAFDDIRAVVRQANAVLVEFRITDAGAFAFLLGGDDADIAKHQVVRLPNFTSRALNEILVKKEDDKLVDGWLVKYYKGQQEIFSQQEWMDCIEQVTGELYSQLLRPIHERLNKVYPKAKRLIFVPNKGLNLFPLHAAHYTANGHRRYLMDHFQIFYAPSCTVLQRCLHREADRRPRQLLFAVQNPSENLPFADWDVEEAAQYFPTSRILSGADATLTRVKQFISQGNEVLLSCHGIYDLNDLFNSQFILHGGDRLRLRDILSLDLSKAWLVVLSACETAVSDFRDVVDEVQGLHTAFLMARAATVVASLWPVSDLSTALLMKRFHENLYRHSLNKAGALREAQIWLRDLSVSQARQLIIERQAQLSQVKPHQWLTKIDLETVLDAQAAAHGGKPFAHPYWWAAFQCVGAG
jgi:CHAT domain-containing protein